MLIPLSLVSAVLDTTLGQVNLTFTDAVRAEDLDPVSFTPVVRVTVPIQVRGNAALHDAADPSKTITEAAITAKLNERLDKQKATRIRTTPNTGPKVPPEQAKKPEVPVEPGTTQVVDPDTIPAASSGELPSPDPSVEETQPVPPPLPTLPEPVEEEGTP